MLSRCGSTTVFDSRFNHGVIDRLHRDGQDPVERGIESIMFVHGLAVETGEVAQRITIGDAFTKFAVIPVLDAHQNQGTESLVGRQPAPPGFRVLHTALQIAADRLGQFRMFVEEAGDLFQQGIQVHALPEKFHVGETDLRYVCSHMPIAYADYRPEEVPFHASSAMDIFWKQRQNGCR